MVIKSSDSSVKCGKCGLAITVHRPLEVPTCKCDVPDILYGKLEPIVGGRTRKR